MVEKEQKRIACKEYEATLEGYLDGADSAELAAHLERCPACREALADARLARELLREGREPTVEPSGAFATRVMASIRAEEARRQEFWRPLEVLASRLAVVAAMALLALTVYVYEAGPAGYRAPGTSQTEVSASFPELSGQSAQDEFQLTLAGNNNGR